MMQRSSIRVRFDRKRFAARATALLAAIACLCCLSMHAAAATDPTGLAEALGLLPVPAQIEPAQGAFTAPAEATLSVDAGNRLDSRDLRALAEDILRDAWGTTPKPAQDAKATLSLALDAHAAMPAEGYTLAVTAHGIRLTGTQPSGLFYGMQTLRQLLPPERRGRPLPALTIRDAPRFAWRGVHLDVARHMFPVAYIERQLDLMARYKFNVLHWHLTDDQGWRLQIRRYPRLTSIGAWRKQTAVSQRDGSTRHDGQRYGGFYTQAQARAIVDYARKLHITVVPEIEMPGHTVAALAAYPELACTPGPFEVRVDWGVDDNVLCPSEKTFALVEGVLDEVMDVFPSEYIHVGGDEAPIVRWQHSPLAQAIIRREGLPDEHALQGWFMRRIEAYLQNHGRRMLAWDEMLAGNPAPSTTIMAWRSIDEGAKAAQLGHDVVMTPTSYSYFDYCQSRSADEPVCPGELPLRQVYAFEPLPPQLDAAQAAHIIGGQANLWTEHIATARAAEFMLWPRALAMAEVLWSPANARDWPQFLQRLGPQLATLGRLDVNYRVPEVMGLQSDVLTLADTAVVALQSPLSGAQIVYTLDGSAPDIRSPHYSTPIALDLSRAPVTVTARLVMPDGRLGSLAHARYSRTQLQPALPPSSAPLLPGLQRDYYELAARNTDDLGSATALRTDTSAAIGLPDFARNVDFGLRYAGTIDVPADGIYRFAVASDDGSRLFIDDALVVDRDGPQSPGTSYGSIGLARGLHRFELRYFQGGGDRQLQLGVARDGEGIAPIPASWLQHAATSTPAPQR